MDAGGEAVSGLSLPLPELFCPLLLGRAELGVDQKKMETGVGGESHTEINHSGPILHIPAIPICRRSSNPLQPTRRRPTWKGRNVGL